MIRCVRVINPNTFFTSTIVAGAMFAIALTASGCSDDADSIDIADSSDESDTWQNDATHGNDVLVKDVESDLDASDAADSPDSPCPDDMVQMNRFCIDAYEAPNKKGELPLVMYNLLEAQSWCLAREKRLCFDDEWTVACAGQSGRPYPYGNSYDATACNTDKRWRAYEQDLLNGWPMNLNTDPIENLEELFDLVRTSGARAAAAADHVKALYQAEPSGSRPACTSDDRSFDLCGNVEEWTQRRTATSANYTGTLKGRYWAEARTCQSGVTNHADSFRFYEIGFRCCKEIR